MRHRGETDQNNQVPSQTGAQAGTQTTGAGRARMLSDLMEAKAPVVGKHRAPSVQQIPTQQIPTHDDHVTEALPAPVPASKPVPEVEPVKIPLRGQWRASHFPRLFASVLLTLGVLGTSGLGVRYAQTRTSDNFLSLAIGLVVVVVLWALVIVGTPRLVSLEGSIVQIHSTGGTETFNLADGLQPVDLVGDPRTSHWAVLLHRANGTTAVLRRSDVEPLEFDPIVRHYRNVANQRSAEREARFNL